MSNPLHDRSSNTLADQVAAGRMVPRGDTRDDSSPTGVIQVDAISEVTGDIERFVRSFIGRFRQVVIQASQLAEQEGMLKTTLATVDAQQAEWTRRTELREQDIEQQSKLLAEAWLALENERRAKLVHGQSTLPPTAAAPHASRMLSQGNDRSGRGSSSVDESPVDSGQISEQPHDAVPEVKSVNPFSNVVSVPNVCPAVEAKATARENATPPVVSPADPWQQQTNSANSQSDAVKEFQRLRREVRSTQNKP